MKRAWNSGSENAPSRLRFAHALDRFFFNDRWEPSVKESRWEDDDRRRRRRRRRRREHGCTKNFQVPSSYANVTDDFAKQHACAIRCRSSATVNSGDPLLRTMHSFSRFSSRCFPHRSVSRHNRCGGRSVVWYAYISYSSFHNTFHVLV